MILIFVGGFFTLSKIKMEIFPSFAVDVITVSVLYPGASPENVEKNICIPIEESIQGISGIKKITSGSSSGYGWHFPNYGIKEAITTLIYSQDINLPVTNYFKLEWEV